MAHPNVIAIYTIHSQTLDAVDSTKYLGVTIDYKLTFNSHVNAVSKKANGIPVSLQYNIKCHDKVKAQDTTSMSDQHSSMPHVLETRIHEKNTDRLEHVQRYPACYNTCSFSQTASVTKMLHDLQLPLLQELWDICKEDANAINTSN